MNSRDFVSGLFWLGIAVFVCLQAIELKIETLQAPGSGFLLFWSGVTLGTLAIVLVGKSMLEKGGREASPQWKGVATPKAFGFLIYLFLYIIFLPRLGYLLSTLGLMILLLRIWKGSGWGVQVLMALLTVLASYAVFHLWLGVPLPKGVLGI